MTRRLPWPVLFGFLAIGCHNSGMKLGHPDGALDDLTTSNSDTQGSPGAGDGLALPETSDSVVSDTYAPDLLAVRDVGAEAVLAADSLPDQLSTSDLIPGTDVAPDATGPSTPEVADTKILAGDALLEVAPDTSTDASPDLVGDGTDKVPPLPKDVTVYASKDYGAADARCVAATPGWLDRVATFLAEDQKCWADSDCTYVSFSDECGSICVLAMNRQRIGEFGTQVYGYASASCSSCPRAPSYPACPPPTTVFCNAGRCEFKRS